MLGPKVHVAIRLKEPRIMLSRSVTYIPTQFCGKMCHFDCSLFNNEPATEKANDAYYLVISLIETLGNSRNQ